MNAAITRRFLDKFFGYKISPITTRRTIFGKSAGRVQSPTLKILCAREKEIDIFVPEEYWEIEIELSDKKENLMKCNLHSENQEKFEKLSIKNENQAVNIKKKIQSLEFTVVDVIKKEKAENHILLFQILYCYKTRHPNLGLAQNIPTHLLNNLKTEFPNLAP